MAVRKIKEKTWKLKKSFSIEARNLESSAGQMEICKSFFPVKLERSGFHHANGKTLIQLIKIAFYFYNLPQISFYCSTSLSESIPGSAQIQGSF